MQMMVCDQLLAFMPLHEFRAQHQLPPDFGVTMFAPKDFTGLGRIDGAGDALQSVREAVLSGLPRTTPAEGWLTLSLRLQLRFRDALVTANAAIGLRPSEIEYAVAGFGDLCQGYIYAQLQSRLMGAPQRFDSLYDQWLNRSLLLSQTVYRYTHRDERWRVRLLKNAYGRAGLMIETQAATYFVSDAALSCPAAGFMYGLLREVCAALQAALDSSFMYAHEGKAS